MPAVIVHKRLKIFSFDRSLLFLIKKGKSLNYKKQPARKKWKEMQKISRILPRLVCRGVKLPLEKCKDVKFTGWAFALFSPVFCTHRHFFFFLFRKSCRQDTHTGRAATHANEPMNILKRLKEAYMVKKKSIHPHWKEPSTLNLPCVYSLLAKTDSLKLEHFCRRMERGFSRGALPAPWARV